MYMNRVNLMSRQCSITQLWYSLFVIQWLNTHCCRRNIKKLYKCTKLYTAHDAPDYLSTSFTFTSEIQNGYFGLPQHIICTHPDQDMNYSAIHLHFQGILPGILSLLTFKTHQMSNSSKVYIWGGSEILSHNCIKQCYTDYRNYIMYTKNVNSM